MSTVHICDSHAERPFLQRHPVASYFALTYAMSWAGALLIAAPNLLRGQAVSQMRGLPMFPAMLVGPSAAGVALIRIVNGKDGLKDLFSRMRRVRVGVWYATLLIPPASILVTLFCLRTFYSPVFTPNHFLTGILFGFPAGFFEEIGWTGYALPKLIGKHSVVAPAILPGLLWGIWHLPVVNYLGTAVPYGTIGFRTFWRLPLR